MNSNPNPISSDRRWILQIRQTINEEIEEDTDIPVSIFNVPASLASTKPDCYMPQQVALGPYHHWRPDLYEMERYKLPAAKRFHKQLQNHSLKFQHLVDQLTIFEPRIRACYHKYLDFDGETLAWMMALDVCFLLEFLEVYGIEKGKVVTQVSSRMSHLVDISCRKFAHNTILRDIVMLENQIPIFVMEKMLELKFDSLELARKSLRLMLLGLCNELSPFKIMDHETLDQSSFDCTHLIGFLYDMIVDQRIQEQFYQTTDQDHHQEQQDEETPHKFKQHIDRIQRFIKRLMFSKLVKLVVKFPWVIIRNIPMVRILNQHIRCDDNKHTSNVECDHGKPPLMEEISIPSVTSLAKAGLGFSPSSGGIFTINFNENTFFLPVVNLDVNTDVVLRNLVAYEVCNVSGPLILTRYTEFMNGIIDTKEDAKLLRERGIMVNRLKNDEEVAKLWNGMSRCVRLTKVPFLDKVIEDVNMSYERTWRAKMGKFMRVYVLGSWQVLVFVAVVMVLFLMSVEVVISLSRCIIMFFARNIS